MHISWERFKKYLYYNASLGLTLDISRMNFPDDFFVRMEPEIQKAFAAMSDLEAGGIANPDEKRMVGHYWLRSPELAPIQSIQQEIKETQKAIRDFAFSVHAGKIRPRKHSRFTRFLSIGIGGSALGPQLVCDALASTRDVMKPYFLDNTDPDGFDRVFSELKDQLDDTLVLVISKSGGTVETRNGMLETAHLYKHAGLSFERHAVAVTGSGSALDKQAQDGRWLARFPMWDWVGGRTSVTSAVGLLPMALQGIDFEEFLQGAGMCDSITRVPITLNNPAALLALMWFHATGGRGLRDMVILPYKDRLQLFARYLQQLIMESLGKEKDLNGNIVNQGITVYGNKGTTDQHAYVQQLREGINNFFVTFIEVLQDRQRKSLEVQPEVTSGDFLNSFMQGTRNALSDNNRESLTLTLETLSPRTLGSLIALYERAVGLYASLVNINAYHQPGVEAGKKMANAVISLQREVLAFLKQNPATSYAAEDIAHKLNLSDHYIEAVFRILEHSSANVDHKIRRTSGKSGWDSLYRYEP